MKTSPLRMRKETHPEKIVTSLNGEKIAKDLKYAGFNMIVTSEIEMDELEIYNTYHKLWRIEESFRTMKSELDVRPVYLQDISRSKGISLYVI